MEAVKRLHNEDLQFYQYLYINENKPGNIQKIFIINFMFQIGFMINSYFQKIPCGFISQMETCKHSKLRLLKWTSQIIFQCTNIHISYLNVCILPTFIMQTKIILQRKIICCYCGCHPVYVNGGGALGQEDGSLKLRRMEGHGSIHRDEGLYYI